MPVVFFGLKRKEEEKEKAIIFVTYLEIEYNYPY